MNYIYIWRVYMYLVILWIWCVSRSVSVSMSVSFVRPNEHLSWLLALDGCTILQVLEKSDQSVHPEQELKVSFDKLVRVHQDLLLLENQIPFQVLKLLCKVEARLKKCLHNFLEIHCVKMASRPTKEKGNKSAHNGQEAEELKVIVQADEPNLSIF